MRPDIVLWFENTAMPVMITSAYPFDYKDLSWDRISERPLRAVIAGFTPKGSAGREGFQPTSHVLPTEKSVDECRIVRFIPDSGEMSVARSDSELDIVNISCRMKSAILMAKEVNDTKEREFVIDESFNLLIKMPARSIEI
jgi:hypothetical protein